MDPNKTGEDTCVDAQKGTQVLERSADTVDVESVLEILAKKKCRDKPSTYDDDDFPEGVEPILFVRGPRCMCV